MSVINILKQYSLQKPVISILFLFLACVLFRVMDIFIFRLDEPPINEILLSKTLGLIFLLVYLHITHSNLEKIGFSTKHLIKSLFTSTTLVISGLVIIYASQLLYLHLKDAKPYISFQSFTLLSILTSVVAGNIINCLMEEGLFRGVMLTHFMNDAYFWKANFLQAAVFGIWHIVWPLKDFYMGKLIQLAF